MEQNLTWAYFALIVFGVVLLVQGNTRDGLLIAGLGVVMVILSLIVQHRRKNKK